MARTFGVKIVARRVESGPGMPTHHDLMLDGKAVSYTPVSAWPATSPQKQQGPYEGPTFDALDSASWYIAAVLCERSGHRHPYGEFPCEESIIFAVAAVRDVIEHHSEQQGKGGKRRGSQNQGAKAAGRKSGRNSGGRSG